MKKKLSWISDNMLFLYTLFLLAFIPLYPKLPLLDIKHTWVYIRVDDFLIVLAMVLFGVQLLRKKASLKIPLAVPIALYWVIGAISTIYAILVIFPTLIAGFPALGILYYLRHIEYLCLFFIAFNSVRSKKQLKAVVVVLILTLLAVVIYGFGQRYFGFNAYLTMNEEFAKGIPLRLSAAARIPSTFAGHYDLAAYLVMIIAIAVAMISGVKNIVLKIIFLLSASGGLLLLLMTASRVSFAVYLVTIIFLLIIQKRKLFIIPAVLLSILLANSFEGMSQRFASTISQADVIVDARTGKTIGIGKEVTDESGKKSIIIEEKQSNGENLPQGSQYINIPSGKGKKTSGDIVYKRTTILDGQEQVDVSTLQGEYVVKKVLAYDISFTTRLGGTWPRAFEAFQRNILLGSGYSSINLASDNNYLRMLGETGALGFLAFVNIFVIYGIYVYRLLPQVKSRGSRNFILGITAGIFGLALNAVLIDVFEASKVAYMLWMLMGLALGFLFIDNKKEVHVLDELKMLITSTPAIVIGSIVLSVIIFWNSLSNYFIGDDFTWLRWAADCSLYSQTNTCPSIFQTFSNYFTNAEGFFFRPGTKIYFYVMYSVFWLSPIMYHVVSVLLHAAIVSVVYLLGLRLLKSKLFAGILALLFLTSSAHFESVFWISATGHLLAVGLVLLSLLLFSYYQQYKNIFLLLVSIGVMILAPFFHEYGVVGPVLLILFSLTTFKGSVLKGVKKMWILYIPYILIIPVYLYLRSMSGSIGMHGDYSYNFVKLPVNAAGNAVGYVLYQFAGVSALPWYDSMRAFLRENVLLAVVLMGVFGVLGSVILYAVLKKIGSEMRKQIVLGIGFFVLSMAPFLGLGNIAPRYVYFGSFGLLLLAVLLIRSLYVKGISIHKNGAMIVLAVIVGIYSLFNIFELQKINRDWQKASSITRSTVEDLTTYYAINSANYGPNPTYYVVNIPIRYGHAWVFPVGFEDAIWFTAQNKDIAIYKTLDIEEAIEYGEQYKRAQLFIYDEDGNFQRIIRSE